MVFGYVLDKKICLFSFAKGTPTRFKQYSGSTDRPIFLGLPTLGSSWTRCITLEAKKRFAVFWMAVTHRIHGTDIFTYMNGGCLWFSSRSYHTSKGFSWVIVFQVAFSETPEVPLISTGFLRWFLLTGTCCLGICPRGWARDGRSSPAEQELSEVNVWNDLMVKKLEGKIPSGCIWKLGDTQIYCRHSMYGLFTYIWVV